MTESLRCGDRVVVSETYHWAKGARGLIVQPPQAVAALSSGWSECCRTVPALSGSKLFYWVQFEEPQRDAEGDGPYGGAEIESTALARVEDPTQQPTR